MSWWNLIPGLVQPVKELVEAFKPTAEGEAQRSHRERMALSQQDLGSLQQFAAEFQTGRNRTRWDSLMDGLNRLPRPLMTLGILGYFVLAPLDPLRFMQIAQAYETMPDGFWALLGIVVAFYFGGRMHAKNQDLVVRSRAMAAARDMITVRRELGELAGVRRALVEPGDVAPRPPALPVANRIIEEWRQRARHRSA